MDRKMEIFHRQFSASSLSEITGVLPNNLQSYLKRGIWVPPETDLQGGGDKGRHRKFSFFSVMHLAMALSLIETGVSAKIAFEKTLLVAYSGGDAFHDTPERYAGLPFAEEHGPTILAFNDDNYWLGSWHPDDSSAINKMLARLGGQGGSISVGAFVVVNVSTVFAQLCTRIGIDARELLAQAYSEPMPDSGAEWPEAEK